MYLSQVKVLIKNKIIMKYYMKVKKVKEEELPITALFILLTLILKSEIELYLTKVLAKDLILMIMINLNRSAIK